MRKWTAFIGSAILLAGASGVYGAQTTKATGEAGIPKVRDERPRIFLRAKAWDGPSVEKIKGWMDRPEYRARVAKLKDRAIGMVLLSLLTDDEEIDKAAMEKNKRFRISGRTMTYAGIEAQKAAAMYDWLRNDPDFDEESRRQRVADMERWADRLMGELASRDAPTPFYSRIAGGIAGLTALGLALHGDSPKADTYIRFAAQFLREKNGTVRQAEDGAALGGDYSYSHQFTDLANMVAAWRSATDWDAGKWIKEHQGNWLERQMLFQMWITNPNGVFWGDGDLASVSDKSQFRMQIDTITGMYRNGYGRTWADVIAKRWPKWDSFPCDYHREYIWQFFVFNDPDVPALPLDGLGRAEVFSPKLHGVVCWRDSWGEDATIIRFKCGDTVDHHGTWDQGKFTIFRRKPLAIKQGGYVGGYKRPQHLYYKSPWSANCVIVTSDNRFGWQPYVDMDGPQSWAGWKAKRDQRYRHPPTGVLLETEANEQYARALGDLSGAVSPTRSRWTRELVFLGYKYLLVLDRVTPGPGAEHRWTLHVPSDPKIEGPLVTVDNASGRLFCRTLLPESPRIVKIGGAKQRWAHLTQKGQERTFPSSKPKDGTAWRLDVTPEKADGECVYLHVLYPTDTDTAAMPACSVERKGEALVVKVGDLAHEFGPAAPRLSGAAEAD
jgi:hypothetical protein